MKKPEAVIFDMDGVIIDSEPFHMAINNDILKEYGATMDEQDHQKLVGYSTNDTWGYFKDKFNLPVSIDTLKEKAATGALSFLDQHQMEPVDGIRDLIRVLESARVKLAVASSSRRDYIEKVLENFGLTEHFVALMSGTELPRSKPDPAIFLKTAKLLEVDPGTCLVIEDSMHGVQAAKAANMFCVGYRNHNSGNQDLSLADVVVNDISEINKLIFT